jgi:pimeloyl-ACP methyl ester carboxylesterase/DNA-binding CsgD family transcriptional regulator
MNAPPVQYVKTSDGYDIAYGVSGRGTTLLLPPYIHSHVQLNWQNDLVIARRTRFLRKLAQSFRVITFDNRGQGLSSRGLPQSLSLADFDLDTEAVAGRIEDRTFVFVACARSSHLALRYIMKHPNRVSALILTSAQMSMQDSISYGTVPPSGLFDLLPSQNWEFFLQTQVMPGLSPEEIKTATEMLAQTATPEDYRITWDTWRHSDISDLLPRLRVPTLVLHARDFPFVRPVEATRLAALIPDARLAMIDGYDIFGDADQAVGAIETFLAQLGLAKDVRPTTSAKLTSRQLEVLRLVAAGRTNRQIADELVLSVRTVERHLEDAYAKLGAHNRFEAIAISLSFLTDSGTG